jgi:RNA polymerase sigma factor (sigma-70 family)
MGGDEAEANPEDLEIEQDSARPAAEERKARVEALYLQYRQELLRMLTAYVGSGQDAQDILQEAYVRLLTLDCPDSVRNAKAFLWTVAKNLAMDRVRSQRARNEANRALAAENELYVASSERVCIGRERLATLNRALQELPPKCRTAYALYRFNNLRAEEIARLMGIHVRGVNRYIACALVHLQAAVDSAEKPKKEC